MHSCYGEAGGATLPLPVTYNLRRILQLSAKSLILLVAEEGSNPRSPAISCWGRLLLKNLGPVQVSRSPGDDQPTSTDQSSCECKVLSPWRLGPIDPDCYTVSASVADHDRGNPMILLGCVVVLAVGQYAAQAASNWSRV